MRRVRIALMVLAIVVAFALVLTGNSSDHLKAPGSTASFISRRPRVIYVYATTLVEIEFWRIVTAGIKVGMEEYDLDYSIFGPREESDTQGNITAVQRAIALNPDVIVLVAADYEKLRPIANRVVAEGIILITLDSDVSGDAPRTFIGTDNYSMGTQLGQEMVARASASGKIAIVGNMEKSYSSRQRIKGAIDVLTSIEGYEVLPPVYGENKVYKAKRETIELLENNPDISGVIAINEMVAIGVAEAVAEKGMEEEITVISCDHASEQISYLERGVIDATIVQKPFNMGYYSAEVASKLIKNKQDKSVPEFYDTGFDVITRENYLTPENQKLLFPIFED